MNTESWMLCWKWVEAKTSRTEMGKTGTENYRYKKIVAKI